MLNSSNKYDDIINLERPVHDGDAFEARHPKMTREARAKIFAPFAALKGYEEAIDDTADSHNQSFIEEHTEEFF